MPTETSPGGRRGAGGQALVEMLVAMAAMLPLFIAIGLLAKYQDMRFATISASRALAFECTVRRDACANAAGRAAFEAETRHRFFGRLHAPVSSDPRLAGAVDTIGGNAFWVDAANRPLLERYEDVTIRLATQRFSSPLSFAGSIGDRAFPGAVDLLSRLGGPGRFGLDLAGGLWIASVDARVARTRHASGWGARLSPMPLTLTARTAILTDAWTASGPYGSAPDSVETRVVAGAQLPLIEPAVDAGYLPVRGLLTVAGALGFEPAARQFRYHRTDVDLPPPPRPSAGQSGGGASPGSGSTGQSNGP